MRRIGRAERKHADQNDNGQHRHCRESELAEFFDAAAQSAINQDDIERDHDEPEDRAHVQHAVRVRAGRVAEKCSCGI